VSEPRAKALADQVLERTIEIAAIPAPTGSEAARADIVAGWWRSDGWRDVRTDGTGNVWALARPGDGGVVLVAAHLDTVFPADLPHVVREEGDRLIGPSVGDDSVALAGLSAVGTLLSERHGGPVWLLATTGEEGLGNLRGIIGALDGSISTIAAVLAVEGNYLGRVSAVGVGSRRWRVNVSGRGGHAWEAAKVPSAVHAAAGIISDIASLTVAEARISVNVGRIGGGEAINARARACWFELDLRADDPNALSVLEAGARALIETKVDGIEVEVQELGSRPAGGLGAGHPLVQAATAALQEAGIVPEQVATSTDANAAHARGIPAVALGVTTGGGEHTPQEWIDIAPIADGLAILATTIVNLDEGTR
jgi:acetylornithine deacetylase/succinyl-diaminopimelate desuccinylase-like protein